MTDFKLEGFPMLSSRLWYVSAALTAIALLSADGSAVAAPKKVLNYVCMTDDGYGRKRSCSASYKAANPNWRGGDDCYTDDGYGRYRQCSASYKAKHK